MNIKPSSTGYTASQRIITPLAPKRVPSVAPGLEGLAAMAPDICETAPPETMAPVPEFVVSAEEALAAGQLPETQIAFSASGGDDWGQFSFHEAVALPAARGDAAISHDTNFDGNVLLMSKAGAINSAGIELVGAMENGAIAKTGWIS
ncbi:MAG: hypothetical protein JHC85_04985, partial [Chthoniobacterales bacterium]|nr:hypothetical protein [Chthoniobacterales bacterium]